MLGHDELVIILRVFGAVLIGGMIGMERTFHGRPAGFRTHALVCVASALLMVVTVYQGQWVHPLAVGNIQTDPTRMAQGIMTGIGFLGAGVIMKEGLSVRGLTTAASIWITAGIGILVGIGFYVPAALTTALTLGTLSAFRYIERVMRTETFAEFVVRFPVERALSDPEVRGLVEQSDCSVKSMTQRFRRIEGTMEYRMMLRTLNPDNLRRLGEVLRARDDIQEYRISPTGD